MKFLFEPTPLFFSLDLSLLWGLLAEAARAPHSHACQHPAWHQALQGSSPTVPPGWHWHPHAEGAASPHLKDINTALLAWWIGQRQLNLKKKKTPYSHPSGTGPSQPWWTLHRTYPPCPFSAAGEYPHNTALNPPLFPHCHTDVQCPSACCIPKPCLYQSERKQVKESQEGDCIAQSPFVPHCRCTKQTRK